MGAPASEAAGDLRRYLEGEATRVRKRVGELVEGLPPAEAIEAVLAGTAHLSGEARGNVIVEALPDPREAGDDFIRAVRETVEDPSADVAARVILLDYLSAASRAGEPAGYRETLRAMARADAEASAVRARALRLLANDPSAAAEDVLAVGLASNDDAVADAAAATVADRAHRGERVPETLRAAVLARASLRLPGVLRALAECGSPPAEEQLERLTREAREPLELVRALNAAAPRLAEGRLASLVERSLETRDPAAVAAVTAFFASQPRRLDELAEHGYETAYLAALELAPELADDRAVERCVAFASADDPELAARARSLAWRLPEDDRLAEFQTRVALPDGRTLEVDELFASIRAEGR